MRISLQTQILEKDIATCKHSVNGLRRHIFQIKKELECDEQLLRNKTNAVSPPEAPTTYQISREVQAHIRVSKPATALLNCMICLPKMAAAEWNISIYIHVVFWVKSFERSTKKIFH